MGGNEVTEWTGAGIGWHSTFHFDGTRVRLTPSAWEEAVDDTNFKMEMTIRHWMIGQIYSYSGTFKITEVSLAQ